MRYRGEIDGLRAAAVLPVVLYHFDMPGAAGGFVGVDVFFVISGFLITSIVRSEVAAGEFTFLSFYERRVRRLLPALFVVLALVLAVGMLSQLPSDFDGLGRGGFFASLFSSNFFFFFDISYFNQSARESPLLHTWSLAVEEQFYIVLPVAIVLLRKALPKVILGVIAALALASFAWSVTSIASDPKGAFYLLPSRAWELLAGSLLALAPQPRHSSGVAGAIGLAGIGMILLATFTYNEATVFPGIAAALPVLGAVAVLYSSNAGGGVAAKALSWKPIVFIGKVSYSWYLWHWPLIAFYKYYGLDGGFWPKLALMAVSFGLAVLSWRFVEQPFRHRKAGGKPLWPVGVGLAGSLAAAAAFAVVARMDGMPFRVSPTVLAYDTARTDWPERSTECNHRTAQQARSGDVCTAGADDPALPATFAVIGDSHADVLWPSLSRAAKAHGDKGLVFTANGCLPLYGAERTNGAPECLLFMKAAFEHIASHPEIRQVVLIGRWSWYIEPPVDPTDGPQFLRDAEMFSASYADNRTIFARGFAATKKLLGERAIAVLKPLPEANLAPAKQLGLSAWLRVPSPAPIDAAIYRARAAGVVDILQRSHVRVLDPEPILCSAAACDIVRDNRSIYADTNHVTTYGSSLLDGLFATVFDGN